MTPPDNRATAALKIFETSPDPDLEVVMKLCVDDAPLTLVRTGAGPVTVLESVPDIIVAADLLERLADGGFLAAASMIGPRSLTPDAS